MLIYNIEKKEGIPLYESLYECIRNDIISGRLASGARLPSKREMSRDNGISITTVVNAYEQLLLEGYITSREKKGYFVADVPVSASPSPETVSVPARDEAESWFADFTSNSTVYSRFPFSVWKKTAREIISKYDEELVTRGHFLGLPELRAQIAAYLYRARQISVSPDSIIIGAGIEYLYGKIVRLLPEGMKFAVENPGYKLIPHIFHEYGLSWQSIDMDRGGISISGLYESGANVIHLSPEHHYPLGTSMGPERRREVLDWVKDSPERYIIEDDYDCEFRYRQKPLPALKSMDRNHRVIYMNTFSKTLAPGVRISYMVLPEKLLKEYASRSDLYSNTVPNLEQYTLARFLEKGHYERHLSRIRKYYLQQGTALLNMIKQNRDLPLVYARGGSSGTHLLVKVDTSLSDVEIKWAAREQGINISCLSEFCQSIRPEYEHVLVINYSDLDEDSMREAVRRLGSIFVQW